MNMSTNDPQASASSDPPIIVHGGSVAVDVPPNFVDQGDKKFKNEKVTLVSLQINEDTPIPLNKGDRITITYK
jgi:hypothetical protein